MAKAPSETQVQQPLNYTFKLDKELVNFVDNLETVYKNKIQFQQAGPVSCRVRGGQTHLITLTSFFDFETSVGKFFNMNYC